MPSVFFSKCKVLPHCVGPVNRMINFHCFIAFSTLIFVSFVFSSSQFYEINCIFCCCYCLCCLFQNTQPLKKMFCLTVKLLPEGERKIVMLSFWGWDSFQE